MFSFFVEKKKNIKKKKSSIKESRNKVCVLCFFCRSVCFCPICSQCPQCCSCSPSRRLPTALLADLGPPGCKSESGVNFEGGLCAPIQTQTPSNTIPPDSQWLCKPPEKHLLKGGYTNPVAQKGSRDGKGSSISSLFQQTISTFQFTPGPGSISGSISKTNPTSSGPSPLHVSLWYMPLSPLALTCITACSTIVPRVSKISSKEFSTALPSSSFTKGNSTLSHHS